MSAIDIKAWTSVLRAQLSECRQRQLLLLQGPRSWCDSQLAQLAAPDLLLFSDRELPQPAVSFARADTCLGSETGLVAVDLFAGLNPDVLCIAAGLVRAGGLLILLAPSCDDWDLQQDTYGCWQDDHRAERPWFAEYFFAAIAADKLVGLRLGPESEAPPLPALPQLQATAIENGRTAEQRDLLQRLEAWYRRDRSGVALVSAERGRGKSSLLGMLVNRLRDSARILVSASSRNSATMLLRQAPTAEFIAPDRLLQQAPAADLLVVDEAATIPQAMLQQFERLYPRLLLATTSGGYEGTGQGFMLRFVAALGADRVQRFELHAPVRWCQGDCLETWLNRSLMLSLDAAPATQAAADGGCEIELLRYPGAAGQDSLLREIYCLLNSAHYRTRPSDLRMLMENPDQRLIVARRQDRIVGVALLNLEGGFDDDLCTQVFLGKRRPRGHLLAQMLTAQAGIRHFAGYRGLRVQRVAVAADWRRKGLGSRLIERALAYGREQGYDYLGASFALDIETAPFWQQVGCVPVHLSFAQGKSSGNHSLAVLRPIDSRLGADVESLQGRLRRQLPLWMTQFLQFMPAAQVVTLLRLLRYRAELERLELDEIEAFAVGNRGFEFSFASLQKFVMTRVAAGEFEVDPLLIEKAVQNRDWSYLVRESMGAGRKQLQQRLRACVEALGKDC